MTEYDDTLIDMSDVDDRLDDETETSSSEIDERRPSASESQTPDHETNAKEFRSLSNSFNNNNNNPILVVSSKYYFHNPRPQTQPESPSEQASEITQEESEPVEENIENSTTDSGINSICSPETTVVTETLSSQLSSGELSDAEEDQDTSFVTANSSEVTNSSENCSSFADESLSGAPEPVAETTDNAKQPEDCISEAETGDSQVEPEESNCIVTENLHPANPTETDPDTIDTETVIDLTTTTDPNSISAEVEENNAELVQSVSPSVPTPNDSVEPSDLHVTQPEVPVNLEKLPENTEPAEQSTEDFAEAPKDLAETPEDVEVTHPEAQELEEDLIQEENIVLETPVDDYTSEQQLCPEIEEETEIIEQFTIPATTSITTEAELTSATSRPNFETAASTESAVSSNSNNSSSSSSSFSCSTTPESQFSESGATPEVNMGENNRVQEKLRQFEDNKKGESEDTRGTYTGSTSNLSDIEKQRRRNLIFDEERFEETFLKCLICREVYNESDKLPKMLHCHHTFCMDCLYQMYRVEGEFRQSLTGVFRHGMPMTVKIQCPTCREGIIISESELRRLPNDHTIMELLCFVNQTGKNEVQYCTKHQMQPLNFFCEPCIMPVCCDCTVIDHKESKGHIVVNVDEAMKKYTPIVEQTLSDIRQEKTNIVDKRAALEAAQDDLDRIQKDLTRQVRSVFDSIREILDEREKELYDASEAEIERKRETLEGHIKTLGERDTMLNTEFNELQKAKDDKDISLIFTGHKSAREALAKKVYVPTNSTKGFSVTFQFSSRADSVIKQNVANLGDIIFQS